MQWLQSTFANRFNSLRGERGHIFQGRYRGLPVEAGSAFGQVCHYIHLNPVWAGLVLAARRRRWAQALKVALAKIPAAECQSTLKSAPWKVAVATQLKETTDVANGWLAEQLDMGSGFYVSKHVGLFKRRAAARG